MNQKKSIAAAFAFAFALAPTSAGVRFDWSAAEKACAQTIDVDLGVPGQPESASFIRHLTWISDVVALGKVTDITHDIEGAYPTLVKVNVTLVKKGQPETQPLHVNLLSGPIYLRSRQVMSTAELVGEPTFQTGETVLLFLTKGREHIPGDTTAYSLAPGHYNLVNRVKFSVQQGSAKLAGGAGSSYQLSWINSEIDLARATQLGNCQ